MTKFVKGLSGRPIANDQTSDSDLGVDALRNALGRDAFDSPGGDIGNPGFEIGITAPTSEGGNPGFEIGISAPTGDDPAPGYGVDSLAGLGTWESVIHLGVSEGCSCSACQGMLQTNGGEEGSAKGGGGSPVSSNPESGNIGVLLTLGTNPDGSHFFSGNRNVDATLIGSMWGTQNLTYSFPTSGTNYNGTGLDSNGVNQYHIDLGLQQQAAARAAFAQISAATGLTFTEITETDTVHANIRISQTADQDAPSAYGGFPSDTRGVAGDIWFGRTNQPYYDLAFQGTWGFSTMLHEIGHTMGLKHGHQDYTNSDLSFFFGTTPRFGSQSLTPDRDGQAWSLMTYTPAPFTNSNFAGERNNQPQSYMQYDLAALQYMYGANYNTNNGDSLYTFSNTTGEMFINGIGQGAPSSNKILLTIWDGGGNDTIDVSNYAGGVTVDLRPGEFSTFDQAQLVNHLAFQNLTALAPGNIAMSLLYNNDTRSLIENVRGGDGNDIFIGNTANNVLDGGLGSDTVIFTSTTGVNVTLNDVAADVIVNHDGETDTLRSIENIGGTSGNDTITGNSLDNILTGGSGGTDVLSGGAGADRLIGGGFTVVNTTIITKAQATANLDIGTAIDPAATNAYTLVADANIANATTIPHATINATATGGGLEYYRVDVTAGATATFDIDNSSIDTWIELINSSGTVLASNDDNGSDPGSGSSTNSLISFTFATAGTYYIRVGRWTQPADTVAQPLAAGTTYQLHISLSSAAVNTAPLSAINTSSATLNGGEGNDFVQGTLGNDTLTGGNGNDTVSFVNAFSNNGIGVTVDLTQQQGAAQNTVNAGSDTLFGFENLIGSALNDTLTGDNNDNIIEGGLGNDTIVGSGGNDTASYAGATAGVTASLALQGAGQNTVNAGTDTLSGFENLLGSGFADSLTGDANANILTGGAGNDTLNPGANAGGTVDLLDGGIGSDTASFAGVATSVTATLNGALDGAASIVGGAIATLRSIENLVGSSNGDTLTGDLNNNSIEGGLGDDILDGGLGIDTLTFTGATAVTVNLATLGPQATGWGNDTITGFENVRTGSGADNVTGDGNDNTFFEGGGNDTYNGDGGIDTVDYSGVTGGVGVNLATLTAQNTTNAGTDTITNVENVVGSATGGNVLQGNSAGNRLTGGAAADTLIGNLGIDFLVGGGGNDILIAGQNGALDDGTTDTIEGGAGNDFMGGGQGNDILRGGDGDDVLVGGIVNNAQQFFTNDGGDDTYEGGDGTDVAIAVYGDRLGVGVSLVGVNIDIGNFAGNSAITFDGVNVGSMTSIERLTFRGSSVGDTVRGGGSLDSLNGLGGDDVLDGWIGNDLLQGGLGNDTLIGGDGLDTATYADSLVGVTVDLRVLVAQDTIGAGIDTLSGIEYLTGSAFGDTLRGNDEFNLLIDTGVGAGATALSQTDSLFGYGGNDSLHVTRAAAAVATNINMDGGDGNDFIELRGGTLSTALAANAAGLSASGTGANVTYLVAGATSNDRNVDVVTVDGGAGADRIILTGVASATINAGTGADLVSISMRGATSVNNYQITLGTGADVIQFGVGSNAAASTDVMTTVRTSRVTDFEVGDAGDKFEMTTFLANGTLAGSGYVAANGAFVSGHMRLTQSGTDLLVQVDRDGGGVANGFVTVFAISNGYTGGFTAFNFDGFIGNLTLTGQGALDETITGATGNDTLSGSDGTDVLNGLDGTDTLDGGLGDDTLNGGNGADLLTGGLGNDTINGGDGNDRANYAGSAADYTVVYDYDANGNVIGFLSVTDNNAGDGDEGADTLTSVETIAFGGVVLNAALPVQLFNGAVLIGTFATIQEAIDAAVDGNTINAQAGTYTENLNVNKDVTIIGANDGVAGDGTRGAETVINGQIVINADGVTIDGVSVVGAAAGPLGTTGIIVSQDSDNFSLVNSVLDGSGDFAIFVAIDVQGLDIGDNLIQGYSIGAYVSGGTTAGSIHDNLFQGDGGPFTGLGNGVNSETSLVLIQDNIFDGLYSGSLNLFPFGPDPVDLETYVINNIITGSGAERPVQVYPTALSTHIVGTEENESFNGDIAGLASGTVVGFDGQGGDDHIYGFDAGDDLAGGNGSDRIYGQAGNDTMNGGNDNDLIDGEGGIDTAEFADTALAYTDTVVGWAVTSSEGTDFLQRTEIAIDGSGQRNLLVGGTAFANLQAALNEAVNDDTVRLATGTHSGSFSYSDSGLTIIAQPNAQINGTFTPTGTDGITIAGANLNDTITTGAGNDRVLFNVTTGGSDTVNLGGGTDAVILSGNAGQIRLTFTSAEIGNNNANDSNTMANQDGGLAVRLQAEDGAGALTGAVSRFDDEGIVFVAGAGQTFDVRDLVSGVQRGDQFEVVSLGTMGADVMTAVQAARPYYFNGGMGDDQIFGGNANDFLVGGAGADTLQGGAGNDTYLGGGGNDTFIVEDTGDLVIEAAAGGNDTVNSSVSYALAAGAEVETLSTTNSAGTAAIALTGNEFGQLITGNAGNNFLYGVAGVDTLDGGAGDDVIIVDSDDSVIEAVGGGNDLVAATSSYALNAGAEVEILSTINGGNNAAIALTGNEFGQLIIGNVGNNFLYGAGGADTLDGAAGDDVIIVDADDIVIEAVGGGNDLVASVSNYVLAAGAEVETLSTTNGGGNATIALTGNEFGQTIIGNAGANFLFGAGGLDILDGGAGDDVIIVDADDQVVEAVGGGNDLVASSSSYTLAAGAEVETLSTLNGGSNSAINLTGNELAQTIIGNAGSNVLDGKGGNDTLQGGAGADFFAFTTALGAGNVDTIVDFNVADDTIQLDDAIFTALGGLGTLNANAFVTGTAAADADDRIIYNSTTGQLFYDADGNGAGAAVQFATLSTGLVLTASDFAVI